MLCSDSIGFWIYVQFKGEGDVSIVPGLGCAVKTDAGERIGLGRFKPYTGYLGDYIHDEVGDMVFGFTHKRRSALLGTLSRGMDSSFNMLTYFSGISESDHVIMTSLTLPKDLHSVMNGLNLTSFFSTIERMEQAFGKPQYFEWAMTADGDQPVFWIIQIADVNKKLDSREFGDFGKAVFLGTFRNRNRC